MFRFRNTTIEVICSSLSFNFWYLTHSSFWAGCIFVWPLNIEGARSRRSSRPGDIQVLVVDYKRLWAGFSARRCELASKKRFARVEPLTDWFLPKCRFWKAATRAFEQCTSDQCKRARVPVQIGISSAYPLEKVRREEQPKFWSSRGPSWGKGTIYGRVLDVWALFKSAICSWVYFPITSQKREPQWKMKVVRSPCTSS